MGVEGPQPPLLSIRSSSQGAVPQPGVPAPLQLSTGGPASMQGRNSSQAPGPPPAHRSSAPGSKANDMRAQAPLPPHHIGQLQAYQPSNGLAAHPSPVPVFPLPNGAPLHSNNGQALQRLPSVDKLSGNRPSSAFVSLTSSYRVQVDDKIRNARPETPQEVRQHITHVQALAFAKEPELLADNVMLLKRERNALLADKQLLLVNKRRLESILGKILGLAGMGLGGLGADDENDGFFGGGLGTPRGRSAGRGGAGGGNPMKAKMLKVLDDSRALDQKLSTNGSAAAGMMVAEAEAKLNELQDRLTKLTAERDHLVGRLEGELSYRRTQAAAVTSALQKQLSEAQEENGRLHQKVEELQGHLEYQVGELGSKVASLTQALADANQRLNGDAAAALSDLRKQLAAADLAQQQQAARVAELEHAVVQRDNIISEFSAERAAAAKAAEEAAARAAAEEAAKVAAEEAAKAAAEEAARVAAEAEAAAKAAAEMLEALTEEATAAALATMAAAAEDENLEVAAAEAEAEARALAEEEERARVEAEEAAAAMAAEAAAAALAEATAAEAAAAAEAEAAKAAEEAAMEQATLSSARDAAAEEAAAAADAIAASAAAMESIAQFVEQLTSLRLAEAEAARAAELAEANAKVEEAEARAAEAEAKAAAAAERAAEAEVKAANVDSKLQEAAAQVQEAEAKMGELLKAKEAELGEALQQMEKLKSTLEAALAAANTDKALLTGKVQELEGALAAKTARVQELDQMVMKLERECSDLKALLSKRKGLC
ncbi:hypothetical protein Vretimale_17359 [Volvox reticuliferus]|uniref:Methyl-accepting transducer domain-containing protein n=2 Tax=Volvox reticuliferus TaxID=1737510 RepID=A0A8J4BXA0_9CHLO|nr:hypothetical protein Vretifemale_36 [Volvox reticuliferus]GIM14416.1 hypothetical protein Vretimale_17359 [Volvox reticuliferus]